jgi:hypothetical protein
MDRAHVERMAQALARPEILAHDPLGLTALRHALEGGDPPLGAGRRGALVGYAAGGPRRRLVELDRRGHLVAACRWREDGGLAWAKCLSAAGDWIGVEPGAGATRAWGRSDAIWRLAPDAPWEPREAITVFEAVDWARLEHIPPLAEPARLPAHAGTAVLDLLAGFMKDQGLARVRYRGPYPSETLFTALLECFRHDPAEPAPLDRFLGGGDLDWLPAPHERHWVAEGVCAQMREDLDKVVANGVAYYRPDWQAVTRREPRVIRVVGERRICSLWALGRSLEDRLVLSPAGEVLDAPTPRADPRAPVPFKPLWTAALAALIAHESAPALNASIAETVAALALEWGAVPGDLLRMNGARARVSRRLLDAGLEWIREAPPGPDRGGRAGVLALEVARLLGPEVRRRAQARLEALPPDAQRRAWEAAETAGRRPLGDAVGRLLTLLAGGSG